MQTARSRIPALRTHAAAFAEGVLVPSRLAFWSMLAGFSLGLVVVVWFFSYQTLATPAGNYLARSYKDSYAIATQRALAVAQSPADRPLLLILGSSVTSSAIASDDAVRRALAVATGQDWDVAILATSLQGPLEQLTLLDAVLAPEAQHDRRIVVALGVEATRSYWSSKSILQMAGHVRLGLRSRWADDELRKLGGTPAPRSSFYPFDNWGFFLVNGPRALMRLVIHAPVRPRYDYYAFKQRGPKDAATERSQIAAQIRDDNAETDGVYLDLLRALARHLADFPSVTLVLIPERPSPDLVANEALAGRLAQEDARYRDFAHEIGADYWPIFTEVATPAAAWFDDLHIGDPATQRTLGNALALHVAGLGREPQK